MIFIFGSPLPNLALTASGKSVSVPTGQAGLAAIDTGTTLIGGPTSAVNSLFDQIPGSMNLSQFGQQFAGMFSIREFCIPLLHSQKKIDNND